MLKSQEPKYDIRNRRIINRATGEVIPNDEPIFILRAKDRKALHVLREYLDVITKPAHFEAVVSRIRDFMAFRHAHPDRMKEPDTFDPASTPPAELVLHKKTGRIYQVFFRTIDCTNGREDAPMVVYGRKGGAPEFVRTAAEFAEKFESITEAEAEEPIEVIV